MSDHDKSRRVRDMFGAIAGRYDFLNHFLSANIDRRWRKICVREVSGRIPVPVPRILDIGCGTGDLSLAFSGLGPVIGCDFCHPMLRIGASKVMQQQFEPAGGAVGSRCSDASICRCIFRRRGLGVRIAESGGYRSRLAGDAAHFTPGRSDERTGLWHAQNAGPGADIPILFPSGSAEIGEDDFGSRGALWIFASQRPIFSFCGNAEGKSRTGRLSKCGIQAADSRSRRPPAGKRAVGSADPIQT